MLQNTKELSHYNGELDFVRLKERPYYRQVRTNLQDIEITILYIRRDTHRNNNIQGRKHIEFWQEYFADQDAILVRVVPIEG